MHAMRSGDSLCSALSLSCARSGGEIAAKCDGACQNSVVDD